MLFKSEATSSSSPLVQTLCKETDLHIQVKPAVGRRKRGSSGNVTLSTERKVALIQEFTKIKADIACGKKHPKAWQKELRARYGGISSSALTTCKWEIFRDGSTEG